MPSVIAFTCQRCGHCCEGVGGIVLSAFDIERLGDHLSLDRNTLLERFTEHVGGRHRLVTGTDDYCIFYAVGCMVHPARPDVCRAWPYFRGNIIDADSHAMAAEDCPGINGQAPHAEFARQGRDYLVANKLCRPRGEDVPEALVIDSSPDKSEEAEHGRPGVDAS